MSKMIDISGIIASDPKYSNLREFIVPMTTPLSNEQITAKVASASRADADTNRGALWLNHIDELVGADKTLRADSNGLRARAKALGDVLAPLIVDRRDAGGSMLPMQGKVQIGADAVQLIQGRDDLMDGIPVRPVDGNASGYFRNFIKPAGTATLIRGDETKYNNVSYTMAQDLRPLHWAGCVLSQGWLESRRLGQAGVDDAKWKMEAVYRAHRDFWWGAILDGRTTPGVDLFNLNSCPGILRRYSTLTLGSASITDVANELVYALTRAQEQSPAGLAPDRAIVTDRIRNRLKATSALPYSNGTAWDFFVLNAADLGIEVIVGKSLKDFGGTNVDGMLIFRSEENTGLRRVRGLDVTPVHTWVDGTGQNTIYASSGDGLELPFAEGCFMELINVTP